MRARSSLAASAGAMAHLQALEGTVDPREAKLARAPSARIPAPTIPIFADPTHGARGASMAEKAELRVGDRVIELPIVVGSEGERAIDIRKLRAETGLITLDPGYVNTGSCQSAITFIDGDKGILRYRGISIEELAEKSTFLEVAFLLIYGQLPTREELGSFVGSITRHTMIHEDFKRFFGALPKDAHPMAACSAAVGALSSFYPDSLDPRDARQIEIAVHRLLAKMITLAAYAYKHSIGQPFMYPRNDLSYVGNFLHMTFGNPCEPYEVDPVIEKAVDLLLILHADHEQNCSTSTVRLVGSSKVNLFAAISAGIKALWGPSHGGANQEVIEMLERIADEGISAKEYVERAKIGHGTARLMGFGHRIYKNFDPRMTIIKKACFDVLEKLGVRNKLLEIAVELERIALQDDYFIERKLYPNVDFYSGRDLQRDRHAGEHVHGDLRARPAARLDRALDGDARGSRLQDRPAAADLHRAAAHAATSSSISARGGRPPRERARSAGSAGRTASCCRSRCPVVRADDSAFSEGRGCYTSVRIQAGRPRFAARHARRLVHGAAELGLGPLEVADVLRALAELAKAAFDDGDGIVRLEASRDGDGKLHLVGVPRALGPDALGVERGARALPPRRARARARASRSRAGCGSRSPPRWRARRAPTRRCCSTRAAGSSRARAAPSSWSRRAARRGPRRSRAAPSRAWRARSCSSACPGSPSATSSARSSARPPRSSP